MPTVIGHHNVKDKDHYPTRVAMLMDVADMDVVMAAMQTEAVAKVMAYDGVLADSLVILVEA
jgi:hypothetical protein